MIVLVSDHIRLSYSFAFARLEQHTTKATYNILFPSPSSRNYRLAGATICHLFCRILIVGAVCYYHELEYLGGVI